MKKKRKKIQNDHNFFLAPQNDPGTMAPVLAALSYSLRLTLPLPLLPPLKSPLLPPLKSPPLLSPLLLPLLSPPNYGLFPPVDGFFGAERSTLIGLPSTSVPARDKACFALSADQKSMCPNPRDQRIEMNEFKG